MLDTEELAIGAGSAQLAELEVGVFQPCSGLIVMMAKLKQP